MLSKTTREPAAAVLGLQQHTRVVAPLHNHRSGGEPRQDINPWQQITDRLAPPKQAVKRAGERIGSSTADA